MILDPFCGTGKIARLRQWLPQAHSSATRSNRNGPTRPRAAGCRCITGDSREMHYPEPPPSTRLHAAHLRNRMADHHEARRRPALRHTYRHALGRPLTPGNSGALQWGEEYRAAARGGLDRMPARAETWGDLRAERERPHREACCRKSPMAPSLLTRIRLHARVTCPVPASATGQRHLRVEYESVLQFRKERLNPQPVIRPLWSITLDDNRARYRVTQHIPALPRHYHETLANLCDPTYPSGCGYSPNHRHRLTAAPTRPQPRDASRQRHGANGHLRVEYESVLQFRLATHEATSKRPESFDPSVAPTTDAEGSGAKALRSACPRRGLSLCERVFGGILTQNPLVFRPFLSP